MAAYCSCQQTFCLPDAVTEQLTIEQLYFQTVQTGRHGTLQTLTYRQPDGKM